MTGVAGSSTGGPLQARVSCSALATQTASMSTRRCSSCRALGLPGLGHDARRHNEFVLSIEGSQAVAELNDASAAAAATSQAQRARARTRRAETMQQTAVSTRSASLRERGIPDSIRRRTGDRIRRGFHSSYRAQAASPTLRSCATTPFVLTSRLQLLETVLGRRVRSVSRATLAQIQRECPHLDSTPAHCFHAMFDDMVIAAFTRPLNLNLRRSGQIPVSHDEFVRWVAMFLLRCLLPSGHDGLVGHVRGMLPAAVPHLLSEGRFKQIKSALTLIPSSTSRSDKVRCYVCDSIRPYPTCIVSPGRQRRDCRHRACD